jgi:phage I-like protein
MSKLPDKTKQIQLAHAGLIRAVVMACSNREQESQLNQLLRAAESNGWVQLVGAIRSILKGNRSESLLAQLDDEDRVIVEAILAGLQNPETLPDPQARPDEALAAPGLAAMIHAAGKGDASALQLLGSMAEQMLRAGGDMARLSGILRRLVNGERDSAGLVRGMSARGIQLVHSLLEELVRLDTH